MNELRKNEARLEEAHSNLQFPKFFGEAFKETLDDRSVDDQHLERRATLTIEREGPREAFSDRKLDVGVS